MKGKRKRITKIQRRAQKLGRRVNTKELASCTGKQRHDTYEEAKARVEQRGVYVKAYKCQFCKYYHIGRIRR